MISSIHELLQRESTGLYLNIPRNRCIREGR